MKWLKKIKPLRRIANIGSTVLSNKIGIDLGKFNLNTPSTSTRFTQVEPVIRVPKADIGQVKDVINEIIASPSVSRANSEEIQELKANVKYSGLPWYTKFTMWIRIQWATARGMVTGISLTIILALLAVGYFWFASPSKSRRW